MKTVGERERESARERRGRDNLPTGIRKELRQLVNY